ncbi:Bifunctional nitrilase/nitrile hydratase NIT4B, partial [Linum perenne]
LLRADKAERLVAIAAAYGSRLVVFPEAFVGGYPRCMSSNSANPAKQFETMVKYCSSAITVPGEGSSRKFCPNSSKLTVFLSRL